MMTEEERRKEKIRQLRESGKYPIVNLSIFDSINKLKLSDFTLDHLEDTEELYLKYLDDIFNMDIEHQKNFLRTIKSMEVVDNQTLEKEDSFMMSLYMQTRRENSIDYLLNRNSKVMSKPKFINGHKVLLRGTSSDKFAYNDYRMDDEKFVGRYENHEPVIDYFVLSSNYIEDAISRIIDFYNSDKYDEQIFIKSQIIHGLVSSLQLFDDGNTRYARLLQNIKLYHLTKKNFNIMLDNPAVYGTRSYFPHRGRYRELISNLAINPNDDSWDEWFNFNLNRFEDSIYFLDQKLAKYKHLKLKK